MRTKLNITEGIFPMPVLMVATYNEDGLGYHAGTGHRCTESY